MGSPEYDVNALAETIRSWFPHDFQEDEGSVSVSLYRLLAEGRPVSESALATRAGVSEPRVKEILEEWIGVFRDDDGNIVGYWGLALPEMNHRFVVEGRTLYTWCAWDSLFIPHILGQTAQVESACPVTDTPIRLTVAPDGVEEVEPQGAVVSFLTPSPERIQDDVVTNLCHFIHFFASRAAGEEWVSGRPGTFLMDVEEAFILGQLKNEAQYHLPVYEAAG